MTASFDFGMVGLGTMGRNLLLNIAGHGYAALGYDKDPAKGQLLKDTASPGTNVEAAPSLIEFFAGLKKPRKIMMLVPAGAVVDAVLKDLSSHAEEGDIIIDGGNSHFRDTLRRINETIEKKIHFTGMGISGGEAGARKGPSIMPGGNIEAWNNLRPVLESVAAKVDDQPCVAYMGRGAAGHYVKMVHNGIEYAIMQLISEAYDLMKRGLGMSNEELQTVFSEWSHGELQSFLIEITAAIFQQDDELTQGKLIDQVLDKAGSKGTGKWTSQEAMDLGIPVPTIDMAVSMRDLSTLKKERVEAAGLYPANPKILTGAKGKQLELVHDGLYTSILLSYIQGLALLQKASLEHQMEVPIYDVVKIWRGGCIIRSSMLEHFLAAFRKQPVLSNLLLDKKIASLIKKKQRALRKITGTAASLKIPVTGMTSALGYLDAYTSERLPVNLIQAQRDLFGAHTYLRNDREGSFHTEWGDL
jgi:6-phosphogluconate dehydrogenase